ncbi:beta-ketoacyl-ACP synthase III [Vallicoccus soli]|uniref:Beta-ketoacyl-[acyl-carrier-protein] synthase III n=1 Tax=Vallicoccus soli TaxID=2339232 RepID=A0A3A3YZ23_9ACTN|nr:beta-ketoacyl-ACP synthase III [Vallicoccus soli]RJK96990.1 ketoacyl-ACP synthase III [Vallicoccus soli]
MSPAITPRAQRAGARITGIGGYRPSRVVDNDEICRWIDSSDAWIQERTGIRLRHFAAPDETVVDMALAASGKALAHAGIGPEQVDSVLLATITHPYQTPSAAAELADRLGTRGAGAVDLSAACAGFTYGVGMADDMVRSGSAEHVLVVGVEKMTDFIDKHDRGSSFIFADGAGAALVSPSDTPGIGPTVYGSDGSQKHVIAQPEPWTVLARQGVDIGDGAAEAAFPHIGMQGQPVFRWAVTEMPGVARRAVEAAGLRVEDVDVFVPHQANNRITDAILKKLGLPEDTVVARDVTTTGNTSGASIPLALDRLRERGEARSGDLALLLGFGAGLVYAGQVVVLP